MTSPSKHVSKSKTIWVNVLLLVLGAWAPNLDSQTRTALITAAATNLVLRLTTKGGIHVGLDK